MPLKNKNILIIDDAAPIRRFLRISLQARGAQLHEADTAESGLEMCNKIHPELVVLDLGLPDRDGLDILPEIKKSSNEGNPPAVVILSVRKGREIQDKAAKLGADDYITKPFLMEELLEAIDAILIQKYGA